jgi:hypothetical protein
MRVRFSLRSSVLYAKTLVFGRSCEWDLRSIINPFTFLARIPLPDFLFVPLEVTSVSLRRVHELSPQSGFVYYIGQ